MFRYLIYRTDFGNTIVRESVASSSTGGTEAELFTDFVIPVNQPLYLWRITGGTDVVPNLELNINDWLAHINPPTAEDNVTLGQLTGYTAQTQITLDGKINIVTGATGNVGIFDASGNLIDSTYTPNDFLNGATGGTSIEIFTGYTATTETRLTGIEDDIVFLSGETSGNTQAISDNAADIVFLSGATDANSADIAYLSGITSGVEDDIIFLSGATDANSADITYLSGQTDLKLNISDFDTYSGATKAYIDSVAAGLDPKQSVRVATTADLGATYNITGNSGQFTGAPTSIDGITLADGDRILVKNQTDPLENGIYERISSTVWNRASDQNGSPSSNVSSGNFTFVETGSTLTSTGWVVQGDGILILNTDEIVWVQFNAGSSFIAGVGIDISGNTISLDGSAIAGNNLSWSGTQLDVEITGGTLGPALDGKLNVTDFDTYSGVTDGRISTNEADILYISGQTSGLTGTYVENATFTGYTATTETRLTGIEDDIVFLSGETSGNTIAIAENVADIIFLSGETDQLRNDLTGYTATTETRLSGIEDDIVYISGITDTKLDTSIFTGYTASTQSNELFLIKTGASDINTITPTPIVWDNATSSGVTYSWSGGSAIIINDTGEYEITYNIPFGQSGSNNDRSLGGNIILNNATVLNDTATASWTARSTAIGSLSLPTINVSFTGGDRIDLVAFRAGLSGTNETRPNSTILIKKKSTLQ